MRPAHLRGMRLALRSQDVQPGPDGIYTLPALASDIEDVRQHSMWNQYAHKVGEGFVMYGIRLIPYAPVGDSSVADRLARTDFAQPSRLFSEGEEKQD